MNFRVLLVTCATTITIMSSGCSDSSRQSQQDIQIWRAMVLQAEQMRAEELKADTELLEDLKDSGNEKAFQSERERICQKWSNVERLSPTPIQPGHIPELMPIPAQLPCSSSETNTTSLSAEVRQPLQRALTDTAVARTAFRNSVDETAWLQEMSRRLANVILDEDERLEFLTILHWEASRAGVDPQLMLGLIEIESGFNQYAVSPQGARGYTQVMPFWVQEIGSPDHDLFQLRTNLRYGALILRHYIDIEKGDLFRALGRYDGNLGRPDFPNLVVGAWKRNWDYSPASKPKSETQ